MAKSNLPEWFPFAVTASFLVMIGAGMRANWKLAGGAKAPPPPPPPPSAPPPVTQAGVVHGWPGVRWG